MRYLLWGLVLTLLLSTFAFAFMTKAVFVELRERLARDKYGRSE